VKLTDVAQLHDLCFEGIPLMYRTLGDNGIPEHGPGLLFIVEAAPCVSHPPPIDFVLGNSGSDIVHDKKCLWQKTVAHLTGELGVLDPKSNGEHRLDLLPMKVGDTWL
jgi:hypothetical protein